MPKLIATRRGRIAIAASIVAAVGVSVAFAALDNGAPRKGLTVHAMGPITVGAAWSPFTWNGPVPPVPVAENPFTFTCAGTCTLRIADCYIVGDQFSVADGVTPLGNTSVPVNNGIWLGDPEQCFASPLFSHGTFVLAAGAHSIDLQVIAYATGYTNGGAFIEVLDGQVADPSRLIPVLSGWGMAAMILLLAGGGVAFIIRMRHA